MTTPVTSLMYGKVSDDPERQAWIFLNHVPYLGPMRFHKLVHAAQSAQAILRMSALELTQADIGLDLAAHWRRCFQDKTRWLAVEKEETLAARGDFRILTELDAAYPDVLRDVCDRPPVLYVQGLWPPPEGKMIALVGTRHATPYGMQIAAQFTRDLVRENVLTVSGLAAGIDTAVHETTLAEKGYTVAVLGHGLAHRFPRANAKLFERIGNEGALMTEFPYAVPPQAKHFPRRNRIISGLSQATVVVEAGEKSGALITARYAAEQGRDVFAVPGRIFQDTSRGCHRLIKEGAGLAACIEDFLGSRAAHAAPAPAGLSTVEQVTDAERFLLKALAEEPMTVDDIMERMGGTVDVWLESLLSLELRKLIYVLPGQRYGCNN